MQPKPDRARDGAWAVLRAYEAAPGERLDPLIAQQRLHGRDAGLCRELVFGVVRFRSLYDALILRHCDREEIDPEAKRALCLAAHQIYGLDRIPAHAVGSTTGSLLRRHNCPHLVGFVNAVVRRLLDSKEAHVVDWPGHPLRQLKREFWPKNRALRHALPQTFADDFASENDATMAALAQVPHLCTRTLPGRRISDSPAILRQEGAWTWWSDPAAAVRGPVQDGLAVVQDRSQYRVLESLGDITGLHVLDCCAAPGGKSRALRERGAKLVIADRSGKRLARIPAHLGARVHMDATAPACVSAFDIVLVDAPCSNSGVWARRPEARDRYNELNLVSLTQLQRQLLQASAQLVAPGGRLVYATCSISPRENRLAHAMDGWVVEHEEVSWPDAWQGGAYHAVLRRQS